MAQEKNFTYTITYKDNETGKVEVENGGVNKARGYGKSWFKTETAARKRVQGNVNWYNKSGRFTVLEWTLESRTGIIEQG